MRLCCMVWFWLWCFWLCTGCSGSKAPENLVQLPESAASKDLDLAFLSEVKPILDHRCVTCHSCYTAPCQLNLAHMEGIRRGATKEPLYDGTRINEIAPTRLFVDADNALDWIQKKNFFPVARTRPEQSSLIETLIEQRQAHSGMVKVSSKESHFCPQDSRELKAYMQEFPNSGMPYGLPPLKPYEQAVIQKWLQAGYPKLSAERQQWMRTPGKGSYGAAQVARWEALFNSPDPRHQLVARYIYEHLYLGHLRLSELPGEFYRLVRSRARWPEPVQVLPTTRPFDAPGSKVFYYRLQKIEETITLKNHIIYHLSPEKWNRWQQLFFEEPWPLEAKDLPSYDPDISANPFLAFKAIPAESRYRFLLDDSQFFVSAFIKGPVCEGPIAVNVIDEHFLIFFLNPRQDLEQQNPGFLDRSASDLALPAAGRNSPIGSFYVKFKAAQLDFVEQRQKLFGLSFPHGLELNDLWDGDGKNPQAVLTVFRHFDNAWVSSGAWGSTPKTIWVMDYPIFERMYYLLVAGFDVFGNVFHQGATRMYMDNLRVESEDLFLSFLGKKERQNLRKRWYRGLAATELMKYLNPYGGVQAASRIPYFSKDPKLEFLQYVLRERFESKVRGQTDGINCCLYSNEAKQNPLEKSLAKLSRKPGQHFERLPDLSFLLVQKANGTSSLFSLIHHKEHLNVSFMFGEDGRRIPEEDRLDILPGAFGSFPNFMLKVPEQNVESFVQETLALRADAPKAWSIWLKKYGISRQNHDFWHDFDRVQNLVDKDKGDSSGVLDLSKYELW